MDLECDCSAIEVVEENEATQGTVDHVDDKEINDNHVDDCKSKDNGSCANDNQTLNLSTNQSVDSHTLTANHVKGAVEIVQPMHSPPLAAKSLGGASPTVKGYGLKKWRRIKRDFVKDPTTTIDGSKILKRGLYSSANPTKSQHVSSHDIKPNSEASGGSATMLKNSSVAPGLMMRSFSSDSRNAVGAAFAAATDSENSEDRSSKSSTAASMPKLRYDLPAVLGFMQDKNQKKHISGKMGNSSQRAQHGKGHVESSKKPRGERIKIQKENSHSSTESDSRSSNFVFMQGPFPISSNGKQSRNSVNHDGEISDEAHEVEHQINEKVQTVYRTDNSGEIEELSTNGLAAYLTRENMEEKSENHWPSPDQDPLVKSIHALQSVQEALENEVQKLRDIGKETTSLQSHSVNINSVGMDSIFADEKIHETSSSHQVASGKMRNGTSGPLETQVFTLTQKVLYLESKLEEARVILQAKDLRISELETIVNNSRTRKEESGSTAELQQDKHRAMELDLEGLFLQKMEAEIEFLALTRALQKLSADNHITLFEERTPLAGEQDDMLDKLGDTESEAAMIKKQAELEKYRGDVLTTEEVLKMQRRVCKVTTYFFMQLVLLVLVFLFIILQFSGHSGVIVPT